MRYPLAERCAGSRWKQEITERIGIAAYRAMPLAVINWEGSTFEMRARELKGDERQRYLDRSQQTYPWWEEYHRHAAPRQIPVIMLEPLSEPEH